MLHWRQVILFRTEVVHHLHVKLYYLTDMPELVTSMLLGAFGFYLDPTVNGGDEHYDCNFACVFPAGCVVTLMG